MAVSVGHRKASSHQHFVRFSELVRDKIGVKLPPSKHVMIEGRLRRRMRALELPSLEAYFSHLFEHGALEEELDLILNAVTTNKTDFYREPDHFRVLRDSCIPAFRKSRRPTFKLWSAASSIGAEAWTSAVELAEAARDTPFEWKVLGTDINTEVLRTANLAIYPGDFLNPVPPRLRERYFLRGKGERREQWRVCPELRCRVRFSRLNLMEPNYAVEHDIDAIFLRNVLIYFDDADQAAVVDRLTGHLARGGHFFVGHSESMVVRHKSLRQLAPAVFQKV